MESFPHDQNSTCEQCGAPLRNPASEEGCLNCLLQGGLENKPGPPNFSRRTYLHYEILQHPDNSAWELGRSARGITYKAHDVNLDTVVALKVLPAALSDRPDVREHLRQAVQAAARVHHPHLAEVFHFGTIESSPAPLPTTENPPGAESFYTMEFVEGESLENRVRRRGPLHPSMALEITLQVARALAEAERCGLTQRALMPSNVMLANQPPFAATALAERPPAVWVKVIGLGLDLDQRTHGGSENRPAHSDLYSLGQVLGFALDGAAPVATGTSSLTQRARGVPPAVSALLESLLERDEEKPLPSLTSVIAQLEIILASSSEVKLVRRHRRRWGILGAVALSLALLGLAFYFRSWSSPEDKSIAVLPFRNLGGDPADAFFSEGVQDDILSRLVKIRDLKVVSRLGTSAYPADAPRDLRAIGRALGVRHLLEGSLRRDGDRVQVRVALIDSSDGHKEWAEGYDRALADAINLQGELASDIAQALDAKLSPLERGNVRSQSTHNPDAYVLYLRGRKHEKNPAFAISDYEAAAALYQQAVALDPDFALAHARLAITLGLLYRFRGPSEDLKASAHAEVQEALRLEPNLGEAHLACGLYHYRISRAYGQALPELQIAQRLLPNDTEADVTIAFIRRRQGRWREARFLQESVLPRDPLNSEFEHELCATASVLRDWPSAALHASRAVMLSPKDPLKCERALVDLWQNGNVTSLRKSISAILGLGDAQGNLAWGRWDVAMLARDFPEAQAVLDHFPFETLPSVLSAPIPKSYLAGCIWLAQGEEGRAREMFENARPAMEAETLVHPNDALRHARLGLLYAYVGRKADAIREGEKAVQLTPVADDAIDGHQWLCNLALIYARVGDNDRAIAMIERLLREPGCVSPLDEACLTLWDLRLRWQWDSLRKDPRFQKILAEPEPVTVY